MQNERAVQLAMLSILKAREKSCMKFTGRVILKLDVCQLQGAHSERLPFSDVLLVSRSIEWT